MTSEHLEDYMKMSDDIAEKLAYISEHIKIAKDRFSHVNVQIEREGKMIKVKQKTLWEETMHLGKDSDAGKKLRELYPAIFTAEDEKDEMILQRKVFSMQHFGFVPEQMSPNNIIKLIRGVIRIELGK